MNFKLACDYNLSCMTIDFNVLLHDLCGLHYKN